MAIPDQGPHSIHLCHSLVIGPCLINLRINSQNVWAIADGITYHYDGNQFRVYNNFLGENALSIWGNQPNEIWVTTATKLIRGDGETWKQVMTLPSPFQSTWKIVGTTNDPYPWMFFTNSNLLLRRQGI